MESKISIFIPFKNFQKIIWAQKTMKTWLINGDKNTQYFHTLVNQHKTKKRILQIQDSNGVWHKGSKEI